MHMPHSHHLPPASDFKDPKDIDDFLVLRLRRVAVTAAEGPAYLYEQEIGISRRDLRILDTVRRDAGISLGILGERLNISAVLISRYIAGLSSRGLVRKTLDQNDTRRTALMLTPDGEAAWARGLQLGRDFNRALAACLSDEEARTLDTLLRRIEEQAAVLSDREKKQFMASRKR